MGRYDGILIVSDFDHTVTDKAGVVPQKNKDAIRYFMEEGGRFTLASGRSLPLFHSKSNLVEVNAPVILYNGSVCMDYKTREIVFAHEMPDLTDLIADLQEKYPQYTYEVQSEFAHYEFSIRKERLEMFHDLGVEMYPDGMPYSQVHDPMYLLYIGGIFVRPEDATKTFSFATPEQDRDFLECRDYIIKKTGFTVMRSSRQMLECMPKGISKASGAKELAQHLGCYRLITVGDAMNDFEMLQEIEESYVPADCEEDLWEALDPKATKLCPCGEGSIADLISRL